MNKHFLGKCTFVHWYCLALAILLWLPITILEAAPSQNLKVSGIVTSATDGEPLIGVSVQVKGTSTGTITDLNGKYTLNVSTGQTLVFSYIGFMEQQVVATKPVINVVLKEDTKTLDEVVVVGYGTMKRSDLTGSVVSVTGDELKKSVVTSLDQALQGRAAGVSVTQNSGAPGGGISVSIRGINSLNGNEPLYVIDGVAISGNTDGNSSVLSSINPSDIVSMEILKDASATAIYGSRGANGVIIVTTKNGRKGEKATVEAGYTLSIANPVKVFEPLNNQEFRSLQEEILRNTMDAYNYDMANFTMTTQYSMMYDPTILMAYGNFEVDWNTLMYTKFLGLNESAFGKENINWEDETRNKNAITNQYNVSVRGGSEKTDYSFAFNAIDQEGLYKNDNLETYSGRLSVNTDITKRIRMGALLSYSYSKRTSPSQPQIRN